MLYSNNILLRKYKKPVPKTWDEMIETAKYILDEEKKLNNTDLVGYNGSYNGSFHKYNKLNIKKLYLS